MLPPTSVVLASGASEKFTPVPSVPVLLIVVL
jgi:hypothetical protein